MSIHPHSESSGGKWSMADEPAGTQKSEKQSYFAKRLASDSALAARCEAVVPNCATPRVRNSRRLSVQSSLRATISRLSSTLELTAYWPSRSDSIGPWTGFSLRARWWWIVENSVALRQTISFKSLDASPCLTSWAFDLRRLGRRRRRSTS